MKKTINIALFAILISVSSFAQQGINYKAVIKNNLGNVVANQSINVRFTLQYNDSEFGIVTVYQEVHNTTTDLNGIIILNIGEGTIISGTFPQNGWTNSIYLITEVDINNNGTFINLGTTDFKKVPMAIQAARADIATNALTANNVNGLEKITENYNPAMTNTGWRLKDRNPSNYGPIGRDAVDFSESTSSSETRGATGRNSLAAGFSTTASGSYATAIGYFTQAQAYGSTAIGQYNVGSGNNTTWVATDPLFEIGNGISDIARANALIVLKNGNVGIGINPTAKLHVNGRIQFGSAEFLQDGGTFQIEVGGSLRPETNNVTDLGTSTHRWNTVYATNGTINTSDMRDKTNITELNYGLKDLMKLKPVTFNWKTNSAADKKIGLLAQDLLEIIPEVVKTHETIFTDENDIAKMKNVEMDRMGVYYSDLIPVLIKAIQELKVENDALRDRVDTLEKNN